MGEGRVRLAARYDCCRANRAGALFDRIKADGNTMLISGVRRDDMRVMPSHDGDDLDGIEAYYPVETWSTADVLAYLAQVGAPVPPFYPHLEHGVDCARCPAWWSEQRGAYLQRYHPELHREYQVRLRTIVGEIRGQLELLVKEAGLV
jgi:3'-phosphoadenosine 5'-phosphosulfate sulfotransferase (PAPS reductase)/FAD synthetase